MAVQQPLEGNVTTARQPLPATELGERNYVVREVPQAPAIPGPVSNRGVMQDLLGRVGLLYSLDAGTSTRSASDQADALQIVAKKAERFVHAPLNQEGADERFAILIEAQRDNEIGMLNAEAGRLLKKEGHQLSDGANAAIEKVIALKLGQADQARCRMALEPFDIKKAAKQFVAATSGIVPNETMVYALVQRAVTEGQELAFDHEVGGAMGSLMVESDVAYSAFPSIGRMLNSNTLFTRDKHARVHAILQGARPHTPNFAASVGEVVANATEWARDRVDDIHHDVSTSVFATDSKVTRLLAGGAAGTAKAMTILPNLVGSSISFVEDSDTRQSLGNGFRAIWSHPGAAYDLALSELATAWTLNGAGMIGEGLGYAGGLGWLGGFLQKLGRIAPLIEIDAKAFQPVLEGNLRNIIQLAPLYRPAAAEASLMAIDGGASGPVLLRVEGTRLPELGAASQTLHTPPVLPGLIRRILQVAPFYKEIPPDGYAGTERVIEYLTLELLKLGYKVTLVASGDSFMAGADMYKAVPRGLWKEPESWVKANAIGIHHKVMTDLHKMMLANEFGPPGTVALHNHLGYTEMPFALGMEYTNLTTVHGYVGHPDLTPFHNAFRLQPQISISDAQRAFQADANWVATVHHGQSPQLLVEGPGGQHAVWLGRAAAEKDPRTAILAAQRAGIDIRLAGKNSEAEQLAYYEKNVQPLEGDHVKWIGELRTVADKQNFLGTAGVCVCTYPWPEPFGMVFIEALATGTPIIAYDIGSVPEIIRPGLNGFIIKLEKNGKKRDPAAIEEDVAKAIPMAMSLPRAPIRADFVERFSSLAMAKKYVEVFERQNNQVLQLRNLPQQQWRGWSPPTDIIAP